MTGILITKADVLAVLNDPILNKINFSVGMLRVDAVAFRMVKNTSRRMT
jgi:hypothetical protein